MRVTLDVRPHPLDQAGRKVLDVDVPDGATVAEINGLLDQVEIGNELVPREEWATRVVLAGDVVVTTAVAANSEIVGVLGLVAGLFVPGLLGIAGTFVGTLVSAGIAIGTSLIFGGSATPFQGRGGGESVDAYTITGAANRARLYEPLPLLVGQHRMYPDLVARPYKSYEGEEEFFHLVGSLGLGAPVVTTVQAGDQNIDDLSDAEYRYPADGTLVKSVVEVVDVGELTVDPIVRTTPDGTVAVAIDVTGTIMAINKQGRTEEVAVVVTVSWSGPSSGSQDISLSGDSMEPVRSTTDITLGTAGEYTITVTRDTEPSRTTRLNNVVAAAIRAFGTEPEIPAEQNRIEFRIRASRQFTGQLPPLNVIAHQPVPVWTGTAWGSENVESTSPAAIFRWLALGADGLFGGGIDPERIDHEGLGRWFTYCEGNGLTCSHVFQGRQTLQDALSIVARTGEASWTWQTGKLGVIFDQAADPVSGAFSPANIVAGSMRVSYLGGKQAPDELVGSFVDPDADWSEQPIRRSLTASVSQPTRTVTVPLVGITTPGHAIREMNSIALRQRLLKRRYEWDVLREGLLVLRGSVAHLTHGIAGGGETGRLQIGSSITSLILAAADQVNVLGKAVTPVVGDKLELRLTDGTLEVRDVLAVTGVTVTVAAVNIGEDPLSVLWRLYAESAPPLRVRIDGIRRKGQGRYSLTGQEDLEAFYDGLPATDEQIEAYEAGRSIPAHPRAHIASATIAHVELNAAISEYVLSFVADGLWSGGDVTMRFLDEMGMGGADRFVGRVSGGARSLTWQAPRGHIMVTITPDGGMAYTLGYDATPFIPDAPLTLTISQDGDLHKYDFTYEQEERVAGVVIRQGTVGDAWDDLTPLHEGYLTESPLISEMPLRPEDYDASTTPLMVDVVARAISTSGDMTDEEDEVRVTYSVPSWPTAPTSLSAREEGAERIYSLAFQGEDRVDGVVIRYGATGAAWSAMTPLHEGYLTESPIVASEPAANGTYDIVARAISTKGVLGLERRAAFTIATLPPPTGLKVNVPIDQNGSGRGTPRTYRFTYAEGPGRTVELRVGTTIIASGLVGSPFTDARPSAPGNYSYSARTAEGTKKSAWSSVNFTVPAGNPPVRGTTTGVTTATFTYVSRVTLDNAGRSGANQYAIGDKVLNVDTASRTFVTGVTVTDDDDPINYPDTCFAPWQHVLLACGETVPMWTLAVGDWLATQDGPRPVVARSELYAERDRVDLLTRVTLDNGRDVVCTPNHGFRRNDGGWCSVEGRWGKVGRLWCPVVGGRREAWSRGTQPQRDKMVVGTCLLGIGGEPIAVRAIEPVAVVVREGELRNMTPVTGSYCVVGGVVAAGCWSAETAGLATIEGIRDAYRVGDAKLTEITLDKYRDQPVSY